MFGAGSAWGTYLADITYDYTDNGGGNFTFDFTVYNTSTSPDTGALDYFEIYFDADPAFANYSSLNWTDDNGWFASAFEYDPAFGTLSAAVSADDAAVFGGSGGIAQGASLGGFKVKFDYSGSLAPTDQLFGYWVNFGTYETNVDPYYDFLGDYEGTTRYVQGAPDEPPPVPEPTTVLLFSVGILGLAGFSRRRKNQVV